MSQTLITREDVLQVANDLGFKPTKEQILEVIEMYPSEQDVDPTGTWDLVIEQCLLTLGVEKMYYPKIYLMMGSFTFLEERYDGEFKTIINRIDAILVFDTDEEAEIYAEEQLDNGMFEGYLIPQVYSGKIEM